MNDFISEDDYTIMRIEYEFVEDEWFDGDILKAKTAIEVYRDDMDDCIEGCRKSYRRERLCQLRNNLKRLVGSYSEEDAIFSDVEIDILERKGHLARRFGGFFDKLDEIIDEDNAKEVLKLAKFTNQKFLSNLNYLEDLHKTNDLASGGVSYQGTFVDDQDIFAGFFKKEVKNIINRDREQKVFVTK